jgi:hypothetical protein
MVSVVLVLSISAVAGVALAAGACRLVLGVLPRRDP